MQKHSANTRLGDHCPICQHTPPETLLNLSFSQKEHLPSRIALNRCPHCNFAYTTPADQAAYDAYYASTQNDLVHDAIDAARAAKWVAVQSRAFGEALSAAANLDVLDYGCGGGDLLRALAIAHPTHRYTGYDIHYTTANTPADTAQITFVNVVPSGKTFDLIILSHVVEHFVDLTRLTALLALLKPNGQLYIEVPNPAEYANYPRREFLYYIDRLHVNHFSLKAMAALTERLGLQITRYGCLALPYKDGGDYPSHYFFCKKTTAAPLLAAYIAAEQKRPSPLAKIALDAPLLVYGFGDHFFRSNAPGGPLDGRNIIGIIDRRWEELNCSEYSKTYSFMSLDEALKKFPAAPIAIAVSWGAEHIAETIRAQHSAVKTIIL